MREEDKEDGGQGRQGRQGAIIVIDLATNSWVKSATTLIQNK